MEHIKQERDEQMQKAANHLYPKKIEFTSNLYGIGVIGEGALSVKIEIDSNFYLKESIRKELREIFQEAYKYFSE